MAKSKDKRRFGIFMRIIHFLLIIITLLLGAFLAVGYVLGEDMPILGWYYEFPMLIFGGVALILTILFVITRLRFLPVIPLAITAFCIFMMQPRFNSFKPVPENAEVITVMSYNIMYASENLDDIKKVIKSVNPDILFLQEFRGGEDTGRRFQDEIFPDGFFSIKSYNAVFSKYPLKNAEWIELYQQWSIQKVTVEIGGKDVVLLNLHLPISIPLTKWQKSTFGSPAEALERQRKARDILLKNTDERKTPIIMAGDFNSLPHTMFIRKLQYRLVDSFLIRGTGLGNTWSTKYPLLRIDYIFLSHEFTIYSHEVLNENASDHYPIVVRISLDEKKNSEQDDKMSKLAKCN